MLPHIQTQIHTHTHRETYIQPHIQRHRHIYRHSLKLCSYPLFARTLRHFSTTFYGATHPFPPPHYLLSPSPSLHTVEKTFHPNKSFVSIFLWLFFASLPSFFLFFGKVVYGIHFITLPAPPCPALLPLFLSLPRPLCPSVSVSFGSTVLIDNKKIIHFIQRCRRNAAMPSI